MKLQSECLLEAGAALPRCKLQDLVAEPTISQPPGEGVISWVGRARGVELKAAVTWSPTRPNKRNRFQGFELQG